MQVEYSNNAVQCYAFGEISPEELSASDFREAINQAKERRCSVVIYLHSSGGSVLEGSLIYNVLVSSQVPVEVVIVGLCASMATIVMLAAGKISMMDNAFLMLHRPTSYHQGDADTFQETAKVLQSMSDTMAKRYSEITGKTTKEVNALWLNGKDNWLDAKEALEAGLVHEIVPNTTAFTIAKKDMQADAQTMFERMTAKLQKPTNTMKPPSFRDTQKNEAAGGSISPTTKHSLQMKKELIASFELEGITEQSTDAEMVEALKKQKKAQDDKILELEEFVESQKEKQLDDLIEEAITAKTITEAQKATYKEAGKALGVEKLKAMLPQAAAPAVQNTALNLKALVKNQTVSHEQCYDYLQRFNPEKLRAIHRDDAQGYAKLAKDYAGGKRYVSK